VPLSFRGVAKITTLPWLIKFRSASRYANIICLILGLGSRTADLFHWRRLAPLHGNVALGPGKFFMATHGSSITNRMYLKLAARDRGYDPIVKLLSCFEARHIATNTIKKQTKAGLIAFDCRGEFSYVASRSVDIDL
jgi:hypothetical protein